MKDKIYTIRGQKVMLDFDLAEIYGFSVSAFNQQVKRNISRFDEDFMFDLNKIEMELLSKSQNVISIQSYGAKGGRTKPVKAFTEQGVYMLMTVLKGELAVKQSKSIIRLFKAMKDYLIENQQLIAQSSYYSLVAKDAGNRITTITRISDIDDYKPMIKKLAGNPALILS